MEAADSPAGSLSADRAVGAAGFEIGDLSVVKQVHSMPAQPAAGDR
jgi:hypothetical protein